MTSKLSFLPKAITSLVVTLAAGWALSAHAAPLFYEDWSNYTAGNSAISSGKWTLTKGLASQAIIVENPSSQLSGKFVKPVYGTDTGMELLPGIRSVDSIAFDPQGISLSAQVAFVNTASSNFYFRLSLESSTNSTFNYWFELYGTYVQLQKRTGGTSTITTLGSYTLTAGEWPSGSLSEFSLNVVPINSGGYALSLLMNGKEVISLNDTTSFPNLSSGVRVLAEFRDSRAGYLGVVSVQSIPEPGSVLLGASAIMIVFGARLRSRKQGSLFTEANID